MNNKFKVGDIVNVIASDVDESKGYYIGELAYGDGFLIKHIRKAVVERVLEDVQDSCFSYVVSVTYETGSKQTIFLPESGLTLAAKAIPKPKFRIGEMVYLTDDPNQRPAIYTVGSSKYDKTKRLYMVQISIMKNHYKFPETIYSEEEFLEAVQPAPNMHISMNNIVYDEQRGYFVMERPPQTQHMSEKERYMCYIQN